MLIGLRGDTDESNAITGLQFDADNVFLLHRSMANK